MNGCAAQLFADAFELELPVCFLGDSCRAELNIYNGSAKNVVAFCRASAPFKAANTFQIAANGVYCYAVDFQGAECGLFRQRVTVRWGDVAEQTQEKQLRREQTGAGVRQRSFGVELRCLCVNVPVLLSQDDGKTGVENLQGQHVVKIYHRQHATFLALTNISSQTVRFSLSMGQGPCAVPEGGVLEPRSEGRVRLLWGGHGRVGDTAPLTLYAELNNRRICCFEGVARLSE